MKTTAFFGLIASGMSRPQMHTTNTQSKAAEVHSMTAADKALLTFGAESSSIRDKSLKLKERLNMKTTAGRSLSNAELLKSVEANPYTEHMRGLKVRNNFLATTLYVDSACEQISTSYGSLVNNCFDVDNDNEDGSTSPGSFLYKINKKDVTLAQLDYDGYGCKDTPIRVHNLAEDLLPFSDFGDCLSLPYGDQTLYYSIDYIDQYPSDLIDGIFFTKAEEDICPNGYYYDYSYFGVGFCVDLFGPSVYFDTCGSTSTTATFFTDSFCTDYDYSFELPFYSCAEADDDDDDDDGDDINFADDYESAFCVN